MLSCSHLFRFKLPEICTSGSGEGGLAGAGRGAPSPRSTFCKDRKSSDSEEGPCHTDETGQCVLRPSQEWWSRAQSRRGRASESLRRDSLATVLGAGQSRAFEGCP